MIEGWLALSGMVLAGVLSPGPNNVLVMSRAVQGGLRAASPLMLGIVLGTLALVLLCWWGAQALFEQWPDLKVVMKVLGCSYLVWMGSRMILAGERPSGRDEAVHRGSAVLDGGLALFCFQFLNPKSWMLVLTVIAAQPRISESYGDLVQLLALFALLSGVCLLLWAQAGQLLSRWLHQPGRQRRFDGVMGLLLIASALSLLMLD
ncbi:LysE family translocator [Rhodovibrionaceae bacterium A322]